MKPAPHGRLLVIAGKGGVGRSTVAAAVGIAAASRGLRTAIAEVGGRSEMYRILGPPTARPRAPGSVDGSRIPAPPGVMTDAAPGTLSPGDHHRLHAPHGGAPEREPAPALRHVTIDRRSALEEYLRNETPGRLPAALLARSSTFKLFVDATPGLSELLTIGKVWELTRRQRTGRDAAGYDLVVLDAPASGELIGLLGAPRTFGAIARVGPVARQAGAIDGALRDPGSLGVVVVATPEQMPVSEALGLRDELAARFGISLQAAVVNRLFPLRLSSEERTALAAAGDDPAIRAARWIHGRAVRQRTQLARLRRGMRGVRCITLPMMFDGELDRAGVEHLADLLEDRLP